VERKVCGYGEAHRVDALGSVHNNLENITIVFLFQHVEAFAEAESSHGVKGEVVAPMCKVHGRSPAILTLGLGSRLAAVRTPINQTFAELAHNVKNMVLHGSHCAV